MWESISKIAKAKRAGGLSQVVWCLPTKHKALSSTPVLPERRRERERDLRKQLP
jgi:hypothetical protein